MEANKDNLNVILSNASKISMVALEYLGDGVDRVVMSVNGVEFKRLSHRSGNYPVDWLYNNGSAFALSWETEKSNKYCNMLEELFQTYCVANEK